MKLSKILLTAFVTLTFTPTIINAEYKFAMCERAEKAFYDTIQKDQSYITSLESKDQVTSYNLALGSMEQSLKEVKKRCKGVASEDILASYNKKKSEIEKNLNAL